PPEFSSLSLHDALPICFSLDECHDPIATLRESIRSGIDPVPVFFPQVVTLAPQRAVLVVYIPGEQDTPFITKDGCIYRRVSDRSDRKSTRLNSSHGSIS